MMIHTRNIYNGFVSGKLTAASKFCNDLPIWTKLDQFGDHYLVRIAWAILYTATYVFLIHHFDLSYFWLLLLPIHYLMGPVQELWSIGVATNMDTKIMKTEIIPIIQNHGVFY